MSPEEISCNCDAQGPYDCPKHNPSHPSNVIASLHAQITQLQAEAVELAAMVERLLASVRGFPCAGRPCKRDGFICDVCAYRAEALSQSPPTGFGSRMLELGRAALKEVELIGDGYCFCAEIEGPAIQCSWCDLNKAAAAITKQDSLFIGGE